MSGAAVAKAALAGFVYELAEIVTFETFMAEARLGRCP